MKLCLNSILLILIVIGCNACRWPSEYTCYNAACKAVRQDPNLPKNAVLYSIDKAELYIAKNGASMELPFDYYDEKGNKATGGYTVWLKRVARTWTVYKYFPTPKY